MANDTGFLIDDDAAEIVSMAQRYFERHFPVARFHEAGAPITDWHGFTESGLLQIWEGSERASWDDAWLLSTIGHEAGRLLASATYLSNAIRVPLVWSDELVRASVAGSPELPKSLLEAPAFTAYMGKDPVLGAFYGDDRPDAFTGAAEGMFGVFVLDDEILVTRPARSADEDPLFTDSKRWPGQVVDPDQIHEDRVVLRSAHRLRTAIDDEMLSIVRLVTAAGLIGAADSALREVVTHVKRREVFGRALGSFQAVKHQIAAADVGLVAARATVRVACAQRSAPLARSAWRLSARSAIEAVRAATQLHGGLGVSWEHSTHWFAKGVHRQAWSPFGASDAESRLQDLHHLTEGVRQW